MFWYKMNKFSKKLSFSRKGMSFSNEGSVQDRCAKNRTVEIRISIESLIQIPAAFPSGCPFSKTISPFYVALGPKGRTVFSKAVHIFEN